MNVYELELVAEQADQSSATIKDVSQYNDDLRTDKANFLVVSKIDKNGTPTYLIVSNALPLSQVEWEFPTAIDGSYDFNMIRLSKYTSSPVNTVHEIVSGPTITQYATVLYHVSTEQVVKAKTTGSISVQPGETGWETYWDVVTDLSTLVGYGDIDVLTHHDLVDVRLRDKYRDCLEQIKDKFIIGEEAKGPLFDKASLLSTMLDAINALNWEDKYLEAEETVRVMEEMFV